MKVHSINIRADKDAFVVSAEKRMPLDGARVWADGKEISVGDWYRPTVIEMCLPTIEDAVTTIGRLLRDGID